jgi:hypothetical protein
VDGRARTGRRAFIVGSSAVGVGSIAGCAGLSTDETATSVPDRVTATTPAPESVATDGGERFESIGDRPRLLASAADFDRAATLIGDDDRATRWFDAIRSRADAILEDPPSEYEIPDGKRLLAVSRQVLQRTLDLGTCYRLTGEDRYADRLWEELDAAAGFPDWNPSHFLDVAEMTAALAVGYDWGYDYWSRDQRRRIGDAIVDHGLSVGRPAYEDGTDRPGYLGWVERENNWNTVCNGGLSLGAFALLGEGRDGALLETVLDGARESLRRPLENAGPNGGWPEGVGYWGYNARYLIYYCGSLLGTLGPDDDLFDRPELVALGDFPLYMTAPTGHVFAFGDSDEDGRVRASALQWLARQYDRPAYARYQWDSIANATGGRHGGGPEATDLLWYDPAFAERADAGGEHGDGDVATPRLDHQFPGGDHSVTFRSAWDDDRAAFLGCKGGDNRTPHGDLDVGTFVYDDRGVRWASDLGGYHYADVEPAYWDMGSDGDRWQFYRKRAEGHNTLVVNPDDGPDQDPLAACPVETVRSTPDAATAITDLSAAYPDANRVERGIRLERQGGDADGVSRLIVRDEIRADGADVWWFLHTKADVATVNGATATLRAKDETCQVAVATPADATFEVREAAPLPSSPQPAVDEPIDGVRKLAIHLSDVTETALTVRLGWDVDPSGAATPLAEWRE